MANQYDAVFTNGNRLTVEYTDGGPNGSGAAAQPWPLGETFEVTIPDITGGIGNVDINSTVYLSPYTGGGSLQALQDPNGSWIQFSQLSTGDKVFLTNTNNSWITLGAINPDWTNLNSSTSLSGTTEVCGVDSDYGYAEVVNMPTGDVVKLTVTGTTGTDFYLVGVTEIGTDPEAPPGGVNEFILVNNGNVNNNGVNLENIGSGVGQGQPIEITLDRLNNTVHFKISSLHQSSVIDLNPSEAGYTFIARPRTQTSCVTFVSVEEFIETSGQYLNSPIL